MDSLIRVLMILWGIVVGAVARLACSCAPSRSGVMKRARSDSVMQVAALQERLAARDQEVQKLQHSVDKKFPSASG